MILYSLVNWLVLLMHLMAVVSSISNVVIPLYGPWKYNDNKDEWTLWSTLKFYAESMAYNKSKQANLIEDNTIFASANQNRN